MIEAIGYHFWPEYFRTLERLVTAGRTVGDSGHHHAARSDAGHPQDPHVDPEVHLPRRPDSVGQGHRGHHRTRNRFARRRHALAARRTTPKHCGCGGSGSCSDERHCRTLGFDEVFPRMWQLYLAYSEAGFRSGYLDVYQWTFANGGHAVIVDLAVVSGARSRRCWWCTHHIPHRPPHRPLQRRRRHVGLGVRRRRRRRGIARPRRPVPPGPAAGPGRGLGSAGLAHDRQVGGQGRGPALRRPVARRRRRPGGAQGFRCCRRWRPGSSRCRCSCPRSAVPPRRRCCPCSGRRRWCG